MNPNDLSWAFITGYYYPKFLVVAKGMEWDERYNFLRTLYDDKHKENMWEERSENPISDMMEYVARKDYLHFFCMGFTVGEDGHYQVHRLMREMMMTYRSIR
jgi:hypothetical protein|tara:strand:+ start:390 stop:695 length:306 start_codon:yes stop_codon:yes gene_type:complete